MSRLHEMTSSVSAGTNLLPCRFLTKLLRRKNLKYQDYLFYTELNKEKKNARGRKPRT
jgi:hypothetical protein